MLVLISPVKTMQGQLKLDVESSIFSEPRFREQTEYIILLMVRYSAMELIEIFKVSKSIARELQRRFVGFYDDEVELLPAVDS